MRTLDEDKQQSSAHRADIRNLAEQAQSGLFASFAQQLLANLLTQSQQAVHLLVVDLGAAADCGMGNWDRKASRCLGL
jgi:hypothetical protein